MWVNQRNRITERTVGTRVLRLFCRFAADGFLQPANQLITVRVLDNKSWSPVTLNKYHEQLLLLPSGIGGFCKAMLKINRRIFFLYSLHRKNAIVLLRRHLQRAPPASLGRSFASVAANYLTANVATPPAAAPRRGGKLVIERFTD